MRAVCYFRVSSSAQSADDRQSLPAQREDAAAYCARLGFDLTAQFEDVESGTRSTRAGYQAMLALCRRGDVDAIVVREFARFGRERWEAIERVAELMRLDVEIHEYGDGNVISRGDDGAFFSTAFKAYSADRQSKETARNARRGQQRAMAGGTFLGSPPYGYRKKVISVEVYEPQARWVRQVFAWYAHENRSLMWIARTLNASRVPTLRWTPEHMSGWESAQVHRMLRREAYTGLWRWGADELTIPSIVSPELWSAAQERMARKHDLPFGRTQSSGYLLSGLAKCGLCGGALTGYTPKDKEGRRGYRCARSRYGSCTSSRGFRADELEALVVREVEERRGSVSAVLESSASDVEAAEASLKALGLERVAVLRRRDEMILRELRGGELVTSLAEEEVAHLDAAIQDADSALRAARARVAAAGSIADRAHTFTEAVASQDPRNAKALLQALVRRVVVAEDGAVRVEFI